MKSTSLGNSVPRLEKISSPEQLDDYIRVSNPPMWMTLGAILLFLGAGFFWSLTAVIPATVSLTAMAEDAGMGGRRFIAYVPLESAGDIKPGMEARLGENPARVAEIGDTPLSYQEVSQRLPNDYVVYALGINDWNVRVTLQADSSLPASKALMPAVITTAQIRPLDFLVNTMTKAK
jgi:hypothetical protein